MTIRGNDVRKVTTAGGLAQILGPNPHRIGIMVASPNAGTVDLAFGQDAALGDGYRIQNSMPQPWLLMFDKPNPFIGNFVTGWFSAAITLHLTEFFDLPD